MRSLRIALVLGALALSSAAHGQTVGQYMGAETVPAGGRVFGAYAYSSENVLGLLAQLRLSFYPNVDFGFQGGIARQDFVGGNRTTVRLGTGLKVKLSDSTASMPVKLALAGDLGIETGDSYSLLTVSPAVIASRTFAMGQNGGVTPYARLGIAISRSDIENHSHSDVSVPIRLGADFKLAPQIRLVGELQLNFGDAIADDVGFGVGVNLPF